MNRDLHNPEQDLAPFAQTCQALRPRCPQVRSGEPGQGQSIGKADAVSQAVHPHSLTLLFVGNEFDLYLSHRIAGYMVYHPSQGWVAWVIGQQADNLENNLARIASHFDDVTAPDASQRLVRLVEIVLAGLIDQSQCVGVARHWRFPQRTDGLGLAGLSETRDGPSPGRAE